MIINVKANISWNFCDHLTAYRPMMRGERGDAGVMFESASAGRAGEAGPVAARGVPSLGSANPNQANDLQPVEKVRTEFPETWIWLDSTIGYNTYQLTTFLYRLPYYSMRMSY